MIFILPFVASGQKKPVVKTPPPYIDTNVVSFYFKDFESDPDTIKRRTEIMNKIFSSDNLIIITSSSGCFHSYSIKYIFIRNGDHYDVTSKAGNNFPADAEIKVTKHKVSLAQFAKVKTICVNGLKIGRGFCTTTDSISLSDGKSKTYFIDDRCSDDDDILNKLAALIGFKNE
jgi:hypothetical protein